jgi:hypothetical protein
LPATSIAFQRAASSTSGLRESEDALRNQVAQATAGEKRPIENRLTRSDDFGSGGRGFTIPP